jgi:hypothetical protein
MARNYDELSIDDIEKSANKERAEPGIGRTSQKYLNCLDQWAVHPENLKPRYGT